MHRLIFMLPLAAVIGWAQTVPSTYQTMYNTLNTQISAFDSSVRASWNGKSSPVVYAPQLENASAALYTELLGTNYYTNAVIPELDELEALGAKGVNVHISFPILYQPFYSSNPSQYQQFVDFYQQLATDVHGRGMKLIVENVVENQNPGDEVASFTTYYESLSWSDYMTGRAQNALNTALLIQPDYMSVITEPDQEASYTGQTNAGTVSGSTQLLQTILSTLQSGGATKVPIGAGAGTWIASFTEYLQSFAATSVEYINMDIYPINNTYLTNAITGAATIHAAGKQAAISEAWDFKLNNNEVGVLSLLDTEARDPFSFWAPLDTAFLQALVDFANYEDLLFLSPFWSHYFSAYLNYNTYSADAPATVFLDGETAATNAVLVGAFSPTGIGWMNRILPAPDTTPPVVPAAPVASGIYPTAFTLDWSATTDSVGVAGYGLYRNGTLLTTTTLLTYFDQNLTPGETYSYNLLAFDASGNVSGPSAPLTVETTDTTPPSVPTNLTATKVTPTSISLSWSPSTGIGGVGGYWVLAGKSPTSMKILAEATTNSYTDPYCIPGTTYYFAVESFNPLFIPSAASATLSATTPK
jgi:fibronectin type III domain protein